MSSNGTPNDFNGDGTGDGDLRDPLLRRALAHAPDSEAAPDPGTRDAIRKIAHNLAATPVSAAGAAANSANAAPWWRRLLFGGGEPGSRMPWNAAFATVLVATFVTVLWHREPIPDAQLDGEARVGGAAAPARAPAPAPVQPPAEAASQASPPAVAAAPEPAPAVADQQAPAAASARDEAPRSSRSKEAAEANAVDAARKPAAAPQASAKQAPRAPENDQKKVEAPAQAAAPAPVLAAPAPPAPVSAPAPAPIAPAAPPAIVAEAPAAAREERRENDVNIERRRAYSAGAPAAPMAAPAPVAPAAPAAPGAPAPAAAPPAIALERSPPPSLELAAPPRSAFARKEIQENNSTSSLAGQATADQANAEATGALRQAAPRAAAKAAKPQVPGTAAFAALDRWTSLDLTRSGLGVRHARGDIEGLAALVGTVARSATSTDQPLAAPVEARLALYRGEALIAVLEIAGDQVRWTPQPGGTVTVGTPPAQALAALRSLLTR